MNETDGRGPVDRDVGRPCVNEALLCLDIGNARDKLHAEVIRAELGRLRAEVEALRAALVAAESGLQAAAALISEQNDVIESLRT